MAIQSANVPEFVTLDRWAGLNQQATRGSIDDQELWWNENLYAMSAGRLRSCWGPSAPIYTAPDGYTIRRIFFGFYGNKTPMFGQPPPGRMGWMFLDNGTPQGIVEEVDLDTKQVTHIGQIWEPISFPGKPKYWADAVVWRPQFYGRGDVPADGTGQVGGVLFGSPQGLYAWDGSNLYSPGDLAPDWLTDNDITGGGPTPMPIGLPGIYAMEVFAGRLWVAGKDVISFSSASNGADFSTFAGGGSFGYFGNKLVYSYMAMMASAGYLYIFGDSSTDLISNVQVAGQGTPANPATTQFVYSNVDPQVGQRFPRHVGKWGRYSTLFNGAGIFLMYGGDAQVIGEKTTNVFNTVDTTDYYPTFAPVTMFGFRHMLVNGRFTDPWGRTRSLLLAWNGAIWTVMSQGLELTHIDFYEQDSVIDAYGTDGKYLYHLFDHPDPGLIKRLSTKALKGTGRQQLTTKDWKRVFLQMHDHHGGGISLTGTITARGGPNPGGVQDIAFEIPPGIRYGYEPYPTMAKGIEAYIDLESLSPDFSLERLVLSTEERTLFGA